MSDAQLCAQVFRDRGQTLACMQPVRALDVRREVAVSKLKPRLPADGRQAPHEVPGLSSDTPPLHRVIDAGEGIHDGVKVR